MFHFNPFLRMFLKVAKFWGPKAQVALQIQKNLTEIFDIELKAVIRIEWKTTTDVKTGDMLVFWSRKQSKVMMWDQQFVGQQGRQFAKRRRKGLRQQATQDQSCIFLL